MNWMPVLVPQDHPGDQDRPGASPGAPSPGAPGPSGCQNWGTQSWFPRIGCPRKGREGGERRERKGKELDASPGAQSWFPWTVWVPVLGHPVLVP